MSRGAVRATSGGRSAWRPWVGNPGRRRPGLGTAACLVLVSAAIFTRPLQAHLQCVPYARHESGIAIHGNAALWWDKAEGRYRRGHAPEVGAVLAFEPTPVMPLGHVAVVSDIIDARHILLDHANWSGPGVIEPNALAVDVSEDGDWSEIRVWYGPTGSLGNRENPAYGFIYNEPEGTQVARMSGGGEHSDSEPAA